ncbi:MAG: glucosamine-6-phosphate deaminase [Terriglobales bacterium]
MVIKCFNNKREMAKVAADQAASILQQAIQEQGKARLIAATGAAQFQFLETLTSLPGIDWQRVEMFHLDEYIGISASHPASFCRFLQERLIQKTRITQHFLLNGEDDPAEVIRRVGKELLSAPIDVAFVGIGENGHLAFNDPPADFKTEEPYIVVTLDEACRRQQLGEGWFPTLADVPLRAISMSIRQILKTKKIVCIVPDARKANAVRACFEGEISPLAPASILRTHPDTTAYLDVNSATLLRPSTLASAS